jgi:glycosyltransferase involved in cell wall biosynthesis
VGVIKVLYIIDSMIRAGAQTHVACMIRGHDKSRFQPYLLCLQEKGPLGEELEAEGYPVAAYGLRRVYALQAACSYARFVPFLKRERIDVVHAYMFAAHIYGIPPARLAGVPLVIAGRRDSGKYWRAARYLAARRFANSFSHIQIVNAEAIRDFIVDEEKVSPGKVRVVLNGVDAARFKPAVSPPKKREAPFTVGYVGSLIRMKEVDLLLRAFARVLPASPSMRLHVVGGGPLERLRRREGETDVGLHALARELGIGDRVTFTGPCGRVEEELRKMDVFAFPAILEGTSNAILEAMASGLPVIASDSGGNRELVVEGRTGCLFPVGDEQRLGELMVELMRNDEKRRAMGLAARQRVEERFTVRRMVADMEKVYLDELGERR